jgi:hypothetical protein
LAAAKDWQMTAVMWMFSDGQVDADTALMFDLRERLQNETLQAEKIASFNIGSPEFKEASMTLKTGVESMKVAWLCLVMLCLLCLVCASSHCYECLG